MSLRGSIVARIPDTSACPSEITQQKRKLRIYISNTYTPSKPEGEEAEKVSSWELRVEGKLLEEVSFKKKKTHSSVLAIVPVWSDCKYFSLSHCVSSNLSWPVFLAQTTQPDVCLQLFSFHPTTADTHTHTQDLIWNTELKPLAVAYHELTSLPSRHQF